MARDFGADAIYDFASLFVNECLLKDDSLYWPGEPVWTLDNLESFWSAFIDNPDDGSDTFVVKWSKQLQGLDLNVYRLAAEVTAIYCLFPYKNTMKFPAKLNLVNQVMTMGPELGSVNETRWKSFIAAIDGEGIGTTGAGYLAARPFHIGLYLAFALEVKRAKPNALADLNATKAVDAALQNASVGMNYKPYATRNIILHLFWPDKYEATASVVHKQRMAANLSAYYGLTPLTDVDETIYQARRHMEESGEFPKNFNMYSDDVRPLWDSLSPASGAGSKVITKKFDLAAQFRERVLENNSSFLWPDEQNVWTPENARKAFELVQPLSGQSQQESTSNLIEIMENVERPIFQILCDARAATIIKDLMPRASAEREIRKLIDLQGPFNGDDQALGTMLDSAGDRFPGSIDGKAGVPTINHFSMILAGLVVILEHPDTIGDRDKMAQVVIDRDSTGGELMSFPFWTFFYLMYPEQVAPIPGAFPRDSAIKKFRGLLDGHTYPHQIGELAAIREKLDPDFDPYTFDFFASPWKEMWDSGIVKEEPDTTENEGADSQPVEEDPTIADLAAATYLRESFLREIKMLLHDKKQLIFEGPPGSGKTFVAEKFARYITGQPLDGDRNEQVELIQFHQSYSYEDFVEGIRPRTNEAGQLIYDVEPGIFRAFAERAKANPDKKFVLIIDEINRGNVSRILGELMLLLEYRNQKATLPYSKQELRIPDNLYIIGTMNSADRSLSQIDYALRRRFYFVRFMSVEHGKADVLRGWLQARDVPHTGPVSLFVRLNERIREQMHTDDLQVGHSYFMRTDIGDPEVLDQVWKYSVMPLLREYFYHQKDREELLEGFELNRLSGIPDVPVTSPEAIDGVIR